jgi:hypothetical protein
LEDINPKPFPLYIQHSEKVYSNWKYTYYPNAFFVILNTSVALVFISCWLNVKVSVQYPATHHDGAWAERRYSFFTFWTLVLNGGE